MGTIDFKSGKLSQSRRDFIEKVGVTAALSAFGVAFFTACSDAGEQTPATPTPPASSAGITIAGGTTRIDLTQQQGLTADGGWLLIIGSKTLVVNVGGTYRALTSVCTHSACDRNWVYTNNVFRCTCHGSEFNTSGQVMKGPATQPLQMYATAVSGNTLTITTS